MVGTVYKRTRVDEVGRKVQRAEIRFDDIAGCLRTPAGGSSRQVIVVVDGDRVRSRLISPRETARLMGLRDDYELPTNYNEAYHLTGDGVAVPVVGTFSTPHFRAIARAAPRIEQSGRVSVIPCQQNEGLHAKIREYTDNSDKRKRICSEITGSMNWIFTIVAFFVARSNRYAARLSQIFVKSVSSSKRSSITCRTVNSSGNGTYQAVRTVTTTRSPCPAAARPSSSSKAAWMATTPTYSSVHPAPTSS